ncbi:CD40 ligand isoform X1 [Clupea harengus]|uniref:CD40 ligand isoform X1 n=1 Tax=Clupea harengus TaxID=7950 RepID=A0A8M1K879_CLUHA|nr:CD40 ligand isoform X1 [Clupea harengus]
MINTYHTSLPPPPVPPRMVHGRPEPRQHTGLLWFLSVVLVLHMMLTFGGFVYLFDKGDQASHWEGEFHEKYLDDFLILKRLQRCDDDDLDDQSLLDCKQLLDKFRNVMAKASQPWINVSFISIAPFSRRDNLIVFLFIFSQLFSFQASKTEGRVAMLTGEHYRGAVAHMPVKTSSKPCTATDNQACALEWNSDHSTKANVDTAGDSRLSIKHSGYYYVYSQVTFSVKNSKAAPTNTIRHVKWKNSVKLFSKKVELEESDEVLLRAYCPSNLSSQCTASQGGVFKLEKDEQLYVQVTDLSWVNYDWNATFFGLYKL